MRLGKTIVGEREDVETESERMLNREKEKRRKRMRILIVTVSFGLVILGGGLAIREIVLKGKEAAPVQSQTKYVPTVDIIDESGAGYVTERMREYVGKIEHDFYDYGYKVDRVIVPVGKARELDVYLVDREEYYKCNLDRGTAETAEDAVRMIRYLNDHDVHPSYVDVRIEEKAYYL